MIAAVKTPCDRGVALGCGEPAGAAAATATRWVLAASILGSSMAFIDGSAVNLALPALQTGMGATPGEVQWIVEIYTLSLASLVLVGGALGDRYGRRRVFAAGIALFAAASVTCGLARTPAQLIAMRAVQGLGAAMLVPGSLALIGAHFEGDSRGRAFGIWSAATSVTAAIGPIVGGWLIGAASWRAVFFVNVPLSLAALWVTRRIPESRDTAATARLDWPGALLVSGGLLAGTYGLIALQSPEAGGGRVAAALAIAAAALAGFVAVEARSAAPMMPLSLFRSRTFLGANLLTLFVYAGLGGALFFFPFVLLQVHRYTPTMAGMALLPFIGVMVGLSAASGSLVRWLGVRRLLSGGPVVTAAGFALFALPGTGGSYWTTFFPAALLLGLGMGLTVAPLTTAVMASVPTGRSGAASGINNAVARAAGLIAIAAFGVLLVGVFERALEQRVARLGLPAGAAAALDRERGRLAAAEPPASLPPAQQAAVRQAIAEAYVSGFRDVMLVAALLALAGAAAGLALVRDERGAPPAGAA